MGFTNLHELPHSTYDEVTPLCSEMTGIAKGVTGLDTLLHTALRMWTSITHTEAIDIFPLLRPFVLGFCTMFFSAFVLGTMNAVLSPVVQGTEKMANRQENNLAELTTKRNKSQGDAYLRNPETTYLVSDERFDEKIEETGIIGPKDAVTVAGIYTEWVAYRTEQWVMKIVHDLMGLLFHAAGPTVDTLRTFILIVLFILDSIVFGIAIWDGPAGSLTVWFPRCISMCLWLPVNNIFVALLAKIRVLVVRKNIETLSDPNYLPGSGTRYYIVLFLVDVVGYFCTPTVVGWIIEAGGGVGPHGRNISQTAQCGAQGAYMGGRYAAAGAGSVINNTSERIKGALLEGK